jgi:hypothetical protein
MNRDQVMDWIDNAGAGELKNPSEEVQQYLARDRDCLSYYQVSLKLTMPAEEVDLWNRFRLSRPLKDERIPIGTQSLKWLLGVSGAAIIGIFVLFLVVHPFSIQERKGDNLIGMNNYSALESVLKVTSYFRESSQNEGSALDYYYQVSVF